jgi:tetratricopeptide (TPR) repeat protein
LRLRLSTLGEQHPATAATLSAISATFWHMGNHDAAIKSQKRAQRIFKDTLGQHPLTARSMASIASIYIKQEHYLRAIELFEQILHIYERTVGRMHPEAAEAILNMSVAYARLGDLVKATELGQESVGIFTKTLGHEHTTTAIARDNLSRILSAASHRPVPVPVTRAKVDEICAMGFSESAAAEALALKNGDVNHATDFLLNCGDAVLR